MHDVSSIRPLITLKASVVHWRASPFSNAGLGEATGRARAFSCFRRFVSSPQLCQTNERSIHV